MSEKEKDIIVTIVKALPNMSERDKGYFLGYAEALASKAGVKRNAKASAKKEKAVSGEFTFVAIDSEKRPVAIFS